MCGGSPQPGSQGWAPGILPLCVCVIIFATCDLPRRRYKTNDAYFSASMPPKSKRKE